MFEHFFAEIPNRRTRPGSCDNVKDLQGTIYGYLLFPRAKAKPLV